MAKFRMADTDAAESQEWFWQNVERRAQRIRDYEAEANARAAWAGEDDELVKFYRRMAREHR